MAVYNIPNVAAWYFERTGGGSVSWRPGIRYGAIYDGQTSIQYYNDAYIMFDVGPVLRASVSNITLVRSRASLSASQYGIYYRIASFASKDSGTPMPLPDVGNINSFPGGFDVSQDSVPSGAIYTDITATMDVSNAVSGLIGLSFKYGYPYSGYAVDNDAWLAITAEPLVALGPVGLAPTTPQNPRGDIFFYWQHNPNPYLLADDPQTASQIEITQGPIYILETIHDASNIYVLPANTFTDYANVAFRVRTHTQYNGWGDWSGPAYFPLSTTAPLPPTLIFPLNLSINAESGVPLEFSYNSEHDTTPTRFDVRYRLDGGAWVNKSNTGQLSVMTGPIIGQHDVEWQVMAYGALGDPGAWSEIGLFFSIGVPPDPEILDVSNSNRPLVTFFARNALSWEMEFLQNGAVIYNTGNQPNLGGSYRTGELFDNGDYVVRMRIANQYGLKSNWASFAFTISTVPPDPLRLSIPRNISFYARLYFDNPFGMTVYIHRAEVGNGGFIRLAVTTGGVYDDYSIAPYKEYVYFVRVVNPNFSFADSNRAKAYTEFPHTVIALESNSGAMLKLLRQVDEMPGKVRAHGIEKTFTYFVGRKAPVMQIGDFTTKSLSYSFYCMPDERGALEAFSETNGVLVIRDRRFGTVYGQIEGDITETPRLNGSIVSFAIRQMDHNEEAPL